jgi:hypothetical protein
MGMSAPVNAGIDVRYGHSKVNYKVPPAGPCVLEEQTPMSAWVRSDKTQSEHNESAYPPTAALKRTSLEIAFGPGADSQSKAYIIDLIQAEKASMFGCCG